ncbi:hypothetical protein HJ01_01509 [Flavobacterium frigoris PS1]|uniref:Uncharacterized protein n=1 Tax=Flavobacterium frigoris (strain PS1) TaxID=1086011 RepID=H7FQY6_FLAFP|nr:hypothetical protein HJ01_01509 [Flavobacterium frigoris PS1]
MLRKSELKLKPTCSPICLYQKFNSALNRSSFFLFWIYKKKHPKKLILQMPFFKEVYSCET